MRKLLELFGLSRPVFHPVRAALPAPAREPTFDWSRGDPWARRARHALDRGDWKAAAALMDSPMSPDDRQFYSDVLAECPGRPEWTAAWKSARPNSPSAWLMDGAQALNWAWEARGSGYAETVKEDAVAVFFTRLEEADASLQRAAALDPGDPTPWSWMIRTAIGLQLDKDEIRRRFDETIRRAPRHRQAHTARMQSLCAKWYGSNEEMWNFVRTSTAGIEPGSPLHVLTAEAQIEMWFTTSKDGTVSADFFRDPAVQRSLRCAAEAAFDPRGFKPCIDSIRTRNYFAFCSWKAGLHREAATQFAAIGNWVTESPWCFVGQPAAMFTRAQSECSGSSLAAAA
jgi:hypothetical protein